VYGLEPNLSLPGAQWAPVTAFFCPWRFFLQYLATFKEPKQLCHTALNVVKTEGTE